VWFLALIACKNAPEPSPVDEPVPSTVRVLEPQARASRVSMALRGVRPSADELARVEADPEVLPQLVDDWLQDPRYGVTVRDLHADLLWMRADTRPQWPARHDLEIYTQQQVTTSFQEAPLMLVEHIVLEGRPYTDVLTADFTLADEVVATMEGLAFDPDGAAWQITHHVDGRPQSGLLSSTGLWQRWYTNSSGKHRNRANMVSRAFLCDEIGALDMPVFPTTDTTDNQATADALRNDPGCVACHVNLDPLAAYFWPYYINILSSDIDAAEDSGCTTNPDHCYPLRYWTPDRLTDYEIYDLPPPGYYGEPGTDFGDLGVAISDDPRFASCAVKTAWGFLTQRDVDLLPDTLRDELTDVFVANDYDYTAMIRELALSDELADADVEPMQVRPEALERLLEQLTGGHRWVEEVPNQGEVPILSTSLLGVRDIAGGGDHDHVLHANYSPSPTVLLALDAVARLAAEAAVQGEAVLDPQLTDEASVRAQLAELATLSVGRLVADDDPLIDELWALFGAALDLQGEPAEAWRITLRGLFLDPHLVTY